MGRGRRARSRRAAQRGARTRRQTSRRRARPRAARGPIRGTREPAGMQCIGGRGCGSDAVVWRDAAAATTSPHQNLAGWAAPRRLGDVVCDGVHGEEQGPLARRQRWQQPVLWGSNRLRGGKGLGGGGRPGRVCFPPRCQSSSGAGSGGISSEEAVGAWSWGGWLGCRGALSFPPAISTRAGSGSRRTGGCIADQWNSCSLSIYGIWLGDVSEETRDNASVLDLCAEIVGALGQWYNKLASSGMCCPPGECGCKRDTCWPRGGASNRQVVVNRGCTSGGPVPPYDVGRPRSYCSKQHREHKCAETSCVGLPPVLFAHGSIGKCRGETSLVHPISRCLFGANQRRLADLVALYSQNTHGSTSQAELIAR